MIKSFLKNTLIQKKTSLPHYQTDVEQVSNQILWLGPDGEGEFVTLHPT